MHTDQFKKAFCDFLDHREYDQVVRRHRRRSYSVLEHKEVTELHAIESDLLSNSVEKFAM